ncbi:outer membrane beta-barrel protein [uncultured Flavobacterium sp.]|uniref:outer membrane beta-barrel protein n=1 Tax=uncultured Flavobacterium sp. TaxID=165435 RepID=UPI0025E15874|nr:outer membrane beta-barrel protein [uncultured Flavobacterium sp.]
MHKLLTLVLFFAFTTLSFAQNITLKGKITDTQDIPLESATVYLTTVKDSAMVDYTITGKNGQWEIKTRKITQPVFLKISFIGMSDYRQELESVAENRDFGTVKLEDKPSELNEVVIESEIPPIRIKSDTLEFNAASFKVRPDANVEALLKQLPGVDIDEEGKITVNGKEVNQILVNGKPFFDRDGKVALQNLPADIINKVQVTDTKSKQEELSGQKATGNNASINLTIDEKKNKGYFGKLMGGFGSDDRYESSLLANYFKGPTKISLLASSNNINSSGFSMDEIFDTMGGGRNSSFWSSDDGSFSVNGMQFGGGRGITQSNILGLNYADEWVKGFDGSSSYFYSSADTDNRNRTSETNFLPVDTDSGDLTDPSYQMNSRAMTNTSRYAHNFNTEFDIKVDSTASIYFAPKFVTGNSKYKNSSGQESYRLADGRPMNESTSNNFSDNDNKGFESYFVFNKAFKKKGRSVNVVLQNDNRIDNGTERNDYDITTYNYENGEQTMKNKNRDQLRLNRQANDNYTAGLEYLEPITDSMNVKIGMTYEHKRMLQDRDGFDFDPLTNRHSIYNDSLTNYMTSNTNILRPNAGFSMKSGKLWLNVEGGPQISRFDNYSFYMGDNTRLVKNYVLPSASVGLNYSMTKSRSLWIGYNYDVNFPQPNQILPVDDVSDPLSITRGNPALDPQRYHNFNLSFRDFDYATRSGYSFWGGGQFNEDEIKYFTEVTTSGERTTQYTNVSGTFYTWFGGNFSKSIKTEGGSTYRFSFGINGQYNQNKGFLNTEPYTSKGLRITPRANFTYEYGELLTINPSYNFTYNQTDYSGNYPASQASNMVHRLNLQTTSYWPKHVVFGNDFGYTYTTQIAEGFRPDFFLWNSSLGYNFLQDRLLFKVKVYDLLNQNVGTTRSITPTSIRDEENIVLKRYVMFSLTFKLDKFAKKKDEGGSPFWWF